MRSRAAETDSDVGGVVEHMPCGLPAVVLRPYPWEAGGSLGLNLVRLETLLWYPLLVLAAYGLTPRGAPRRALAFPVLASIGSVLVYASVEGNWELRSVIVGSRCGVPRCSRPSECRRSPHAAIAVRGSLLTLGVPLRSLADMALDSHPPRRTTIVAGVGGASWTETWQKRELLGAMVRRDFALRYKQTFIGAGWAVLQPLGLTLVLAVFFGRFVPNPVEGLPYAVFMLPAMVVWQFFSKALSMAGVSLSQNYEVVTKVFFPRLFLPFASIIAALVDLVCALAAAIVVMAAYRRGPGWAVVVAPVFIVVAIMAEVGVGAFFAAFDTRYRDFRHALPFVLQLWFFATPVVYSSATIPERYRWIYFLNPMAGAVEGFRWALLADVPTPSPRGLVLSGLVALVLMVLGLRYFRRAEGAIVDIL